MRSEPVRLLSIAMAASIAAGLSLPAAAQWKWRDRVGHVQYSDRPPPPGIANNGIVQRPQAARRLAASPVASKAASAAASAVSAPLPAAPASKPELEARRRKAEQEEAARRKGDELRRLRCVPTTACGPTTNCARSTRVSTWFASTPAANASSSTTRRAPSNRSACAAWSRPTASSAGRRPVVAPPSALGKRPPAPCLHRIDGERTPELDAVAVAQRRLAGSGRVDQPAPDADARAGGHRDAAGLHGVGQRGAGRQCQFRPLHASGARTADDLDAQPAGCGRPTHRAPYTCSARRTNESTKVLAILSNTGLTSASSTRLAKA